jgi:uracil-DNA glycosylase family 4
MRYHIGPEGPRNASLAIVAEKPGREELSYLEQHGTGRPLIGVSGRAVDRHLERVGSSRGQVWLTNAVQDFDTLGNPTDADIRRERVRLYRELSSLPNLNCVVAMGNAAMLALSNFHYGDIMRRRGSILPTTFGAKMVPTLHPAFYMRGEWRYRPVVEFDLKRALDESKTRALSLPERTYYIEPTFSEAIEWMESLQGAKYLSFDIETHRPQWISCISFSDHFNRSYCIPIMRGNRSSYWPNREEVQIWRAIQRVLAQPVVCYVTQNGLFDCWHLWRHGIETPYMSTGFDTMYAHRTIAPDLPHALHFLVSIYTREPYYKDESGRWDEDYRSTPDRQFWTYNSKDSSTTLEVAFAEIEDMRELGLLDYYLKYRQSKFNTLLDMRKGGIRVDTERLAAVRSKLMEERAGAETRLSSELGWSPNTKSYIDMGRLFGQLGISFYTTPTGRPKSNEDSMVAYIHQAGNSNNTKAVEMLGLCLDITERRTLESGFLNIALDKHDFYHPSYDLSKAVTGRDQSEGAPEGGPQLMNIPKPIRVVFVADESGPDWEVTQVDLKTTEARISAWEAQDVFLIAAFEQNKDVYCVNACKIYAGWTDTSRLPPDHLINSFKGTDKRQRSKVATLAFDYKMGPRKFVIIQARAGAHYTEAEAKFIQSVVLSPAKRRWHEEVAEQLRQTGWLTNAFGLKREFYGIFDEDMIRAGLSWKAQSVVAHIDAVAKVYLARELPKLGARLMTTTHDSSTISNRRSRREELIGIVHRAYNQPMTIHGRRLLIPIDITHGPSWGEQK